MMAASNSRTDMQLAELLKGVVDIGERIECYVTRLVLDSRAIQPGDLFFAIPGHQVDGRKFIDDAISKGASAVLWESDKGSVPIPIAWRGKADSHDVPVIAVENLKELVGVFADRFYLEPSKSMYTIGITGTNGKTSCSQFIAQALQEEMKCGVIGTMGWGFIDELQHSAHTTPDAITCHKWLAEMKQAGATAVVMEVSSHALDQGRVNSVHFDCAVFTNLTHEHLDYHGDMQSYGETKARLFNWQNLSTCIINIDDEFGRQLASDKAGKCEIVTYGLSSAESRPDIYADEINYHRDGMSAQIHTRYGSASMQSHLYGKFNIHNLLATLGVLLHAGISFKTAMQKINTIRAINGRMQVMHNTGSPVVIIDYAHTPDALQHALAALAEHGFGKIWCVFGCGGDRDRAKRPAMGTIAYELADQIVLTNDNPRYEDPEQIIAEIRSGVPFDAEIIVEKDRASAIVYAITHAAPEDVVLVAGKGHETWQQVGDERIPFSDQEVVAQVFSGGNA